MTLKQKHLDYVNLLKEYNEHTNIYSKKAYHHLEKHIQDCIQLAAIIKDKEQVVFDFGSGSGLPSIILAIENPKNNVYAIESKSRKTKFLEQVKEALDLNNLEIINRNINEFLHHSPIKADVITAKAFGSAEKVLGLRKLMKGKAPHIYIPISEQQSKEKQVKNSQIIKKDEFLYLSIR